MKVRLHCIACASEGIESNWVGEQPIGNSILYKFTCPHGHVTEAFYEGFKFETLFEIGLNTLKNGFYREAASTFATALERFYEYSILVLLMAKFSPTDYGTFDNEALTRFEKLWKTSLKFSERQIGAFCALYFNEFGEAPQLLDEFSAKALKPTPTIIKNPTNFRNRVVHEGYIPSYDETFEYGEIVSKYIGMLLTKYQEHDYSRYPEAHRGINSAFYMALLERLMVFIKRGEQSMTINLYIGGTGNFLSNNTRFHAMPISMADYLNSLNAVR
jgi:hypothetical protein